MPGQPAATVGSLTGHGGVVTTGAPNVLINGQPAARQGDLHVCPLCSPTPHVGGPILNGVPSVLIAGQPIATVSSLATCAAPAPDVIAQGAPNVLVGPGGPLVEFELGCTVSFEPGCTVKVGGQGTDASASAAATEALALAQAAATGSIEATEEAEPAARVRYVDKGGEPISGPRYKHAGGGGPSGSVETGSALRIHGEVRRAGPPGADQQETSPFGVTAAQWSKEEARVDEEVGVEAKAFGYEEGTSANVLIYRREDGSDTLVTDLDAEVSGEKVEARWTFELPEEERFDPERAAETAGPAGPEEKPRLSMPVYVAEVHVPPETAETGALVCQSTVELSLTGPMGKPAEGEPYVVRFVNGEVRTGRLDGQGRAKIEEAPPCRHAVEFPNQPGGVDRRAKDER